ncbi:MAG: CARDB domain-containing protein [Thermoanaerobaculum sp.]
MIKNVVTAFGLLFGVTRLFGGEPPPLPVFENLTVVATCTLDAQENLYRYRYTITNPASNSVELIRIYLPVGPWTDVSVNPVPPPPRPDWYHCYIRPGGSDREPSEPHIRWSQSDFPPGTSHARYGFSTTRPPSIRECWLEPNLHWYFQDWLEATGEDELDLELTESIKESYVRKVPTLGPLPVEPGSFQHFDTLLADVDRAAQLGWISDFLLVGEIKQKLSEARAAAVAQDFVNMHEKLHAVMTTMEGAPPEKRREEAYALVVLNAQYLDRSLPWPCDPKLVLEPLEQSHNLGEEAQVKARLWNAATGLPLSNIPLTMVVKEGPHVGTTHSGQTDGQGELVFRYRGTQLGTDRIGIEEREPSIVGTTSKSVVERRLEQNRQLLHVFEASSAELKKMLNLTEQEIVRRREELRALLEQSAQPAVSEEERKRALIRAQVELEAWGMAVPMAPAKKPQHLRLQNSESGCGYWFQSGATAQVHWTGGGDLLVESFIPQYLISEPGKTFYITERTANRGNVAVPATITRYYLGIKHPLDPSQATVVGQRQLPSLAPGEDSAVRLVPFTVPAGLPPGQYYLDACADAKGEVTELSETNNCASSRLHTVIYAMPPNQPPVCSTAAAEPALLWPPNHKLVEVGIGGVSDPDGDAVTITVTGVTQDEPTEGLGDGDSCPDAEVLEGGKVRLRAERSGSGDGRVYMVSFTASDGRGGSCSGSVRVGVPHDQSREPVDSGQNHDARVCPGQGAKR